MIRGRQPSITTSGRKSGASGKAAKPPRPTFSIISLFAADRSKKRKSTLPSSSSAFGDADGGGGGSSSAPAAAAASASGAFGGVAGESAACDDALRADLAGASGGSEASRGKLKECPLCFEEQPLENFCIVSTCSHRSCAGCVRQYLRIEIAESRVSITCPECSELLHPSDIKRLLRNDALMDKWEKFMLRRVLVSDPDTRWCPAPDCGYAVIASGCAGCPKLQCQRPGCNAYFCYHCKQEWHPSQTCDAARLQRTANLRAAISSFSADALIPGPREEIKLCPRCKSYITKLDDGSCNHMTCTLCGAQFCWLCNKEITDLHYLSPSGCTFWGKKPWSRKKKILWQLGTLLGAPVGIALLASLAVPVIVVAFPVYAGKWLYQRHKNKSRARRNAIIVAGVAGAFILSPLVAGLAVAIGVPVMLTYVYGVVPISLCRGANSSGHQPAAQATGAGGVQFDFEDSVPTENAHASVPNPSIAPSIGEASLWAANSYSASITQIDHAGCTRDGRPVMAADEQSDAESASQKVMVGPSLNGSLYDTESAAGQIRLEIHADIAPRHVVHRNSFSSESTSACVSMADSKSVALSVATGDSLSVKALAGSLVALREKETHAQTSSHTSAADQCTVIDEEEKSKAVFESNTVISDAPKHKCRSSSHGSPVSNRSVTFAPTLEEHLVVRHPSIKLGKRRDKPADKCSADYGAATYGSCYGSCAPTSCAVSPPIEGEGARFSALHEYPSRPESVPCASGEGRLAACLSHLPQHSGYNKDASLTPLPRLCHDVERGQCVADAQLGATAFPCSITMDDSCHRADADVASASNVVSQQQTVTAVVANAASLRDCENCIVCDASLRAESSRLWRRASCEIAMENGLPADIV